MPKLDQFCIPRSEWERLIDEWIFNERDRRMIKRRLLDGITFERLAGEFDLSTQQVCTVIYRAQSIIFREAEKTIKK